MASVLLCSVPAWAAGGYVHDAAGDVSVVVGNNSARPAAKNDPIAPGTEVHTGTEGYAVLKFEDGQVATMQANTTIYVRQYRYDTKLINKNSVFFSRFSGGMRFITGLIGQRDHQAFRLSTPNATIGIRGTEFVVAMNKGALYSQVIKGSISMTNSAGTVVFKAGQIILVKTAHSLPKTIPAAALPQGIFSQLDAIPTPLATPTPIPAAGTAAITTAATGIAADAVPGAALNVADIATAGVAASALFAGATNAGTPGVVSPDAAPLDAVPSADKTRVASTKTAPPPDAKTISLTGAGATYTGADLLCDFCTGRTNTVPTHIAPDAAAEGAVTGDSNLFGKHNLTATGANTGEICAFCHTPQGAEGKVSAPRWNRTLTTLSSYRSFSSLGSATQEASSTISMSCLSCHDGGQAPNIVINNPNLRLDVGNVDVYIGNDLRNHHPVGIQYAGGEQNQYEPDVSINLPNRYDRLAEMNRFATGNKFGGTYLTAKLLGGRTGDAFADVLPLSNEGDFKSNKGGFNKSMYSGTGSGTVWWVKSPNSKIGRQKTDLYLFTRADTIDSLPDESVLNRPYVECATCHDPHSTNPTFLRLPGGNVRSQICLSCHVK